MNNFSLTDWLTGSPAVTPGQTTVTPPACYHSRGEESLASRLGASGGYWLLVITVPSNQVLRVWPHPTSLVLSLSHRGVLDTLHWAWLPLAWLTHCASYTDGGFYHQNNWNNFHIQDQGQGQGQGHRELEWKHYHSNIDCMNTPPDWRYLSR